MEENQEKKEFIVLNQFKPKQNFSSLDNENRTFLKTSLGGTIEENIPSDVVWIDDAFYIKETRFGLYISVLKDPYGAHFLTGSTYKGVEEMTRWHLKCLQDGTLDHYTRVVGNASVDGKL